MKKVIIAIDYNPCAQKIAETGFEYAKAMKAEICIVHAIADIDYYSLGYSPIMGFEGFSADCSYKSIEEQENEAKRFLEAVAHHLGDSNIKIKVVEGRAAEAILGYAAVWKADLVVLGAQSHNGFEKLLVGNVVAKVLKHAEIPILIIPTGKKKPAFLTEKEEKHLLLEEKQVAEN